MRRFILVYACLLLLGNLNAQTATTNRFRVFGIPQTISEENPGISKALETELLKAQSAQDAFKIINNRFKKYYNTKLKVREQLSERVNYYTYYVGAFKEEKKSITDITATRDLVDNTVYKRYQLKVLFSDTVAVIDTLVVNIYPADFNFKISDYFLKVPLNDNGMIHLPYAGNHLMIYHDLFSKDSLLLFSATLFNVKETDKEINSFFIKFLSGSEKNELYELYLMLKENPELQQIEIARQLQTFVKAEFGNISLKNISEWLEKIKT